MVVKTELCNFSGMRIYPGHGMRFVRGDSRVFTFLSAKTKLSFQMRRNPRKLCWTQLYRRMHKKGALEEVQKRKARRVIKVDRAIVGASLETIHAKRNQKPEVRKEAREAALREIKERKKVKRAEKAKLAKPTSSVPTKHALPKSKPVQKGGKGGKGGR